MRLRIGALLAFGLCLGMACCADGSPAAEPSELTIVIVDGAGTSTTWTLTCQPTGGTHPDPEGACAALEEHRTALDPVPADKMCAQVYGGPQRATITGTWRGERIDAALARTDSCETARWNALVPLVPSGGR